MKICNFSYNGNERVGLVISGSRDNYDELRIVDAYLGYASLLSSRGKSRPYDVARAALPSDMISFLEGGQASVDAISEVDQYVRENPAAVGPLNERIIFGINEAKLFAPVRKPGMVLCGVLNTSVIFNRLRTWTDRKRPSHPFYFMKARSSIIGPGDHIEVPELLAWPEAELGIVINRTAKNISAADFNNYIIGYTVFNDVTAGGLHEDDTVHYINPDGSEGLPFRFLSRYKGFDTFGPMGPWIVTKDEIENPNRLGIKCWISGILAQDGNTSELSSTCESLTEYISSVHTLSPGDIVVSGTCPPSKGRLLRDNDLRKIGGACTCEIEKVGKLTNPIKPITTNRKYIEGAQVL